MTSQTCWRTEAAWPWENETLAQALEESPGSSRHGRPPGALRQRALGHAVHGALDREDCGLDGALDGAQGRVRAGSSCHIRQVGMAGSSRLLPSACS